MRAEEELKIVRSGHPFLVFASVTLLALFAFAGGKDAMAILGDDPTLGQANTVTINYQARTGFTFKLNGLENIPSTVQDVTTPRNSRTQNFGILANMNGSSVDSYAYMLKINYFRISNVTR